MYPWVPLCVCIVLQIISTTISIQIENKAKNEKGNRSIWMLFIFIIINTCAAWPLCKNINGRRELIIAGMFFSAFVVTTFVHVATEAINGSV